MRDLDILASMKANTVHTIAALEKAIEDKVKSSNDVRNSMNKTSTQLSPIQTSQQ